MKLKQLKKVQKALAEFIELAKTEDQNHVVDMDNCEQCIYALVTGELYEASAIDSRFKLIPKNGSYESSAAGKAIYRLFYASDLWGSVRGITVAEWIVAAEYVQAKLALLVQKKRIKKHSRKAGLID